MQISDPSRLFGQPVIGQDGSKIGTAENVYLDNETNQPEWVEVKTGLFGTKTSLVPIIDAHPDVDGIRVPYDKSKIKSSPHHEPGTELSEPDEAELFAYYGIRHSGWSGQETAGPRTGQTDIAAGIRGPDDAMTRSEERLRVGTQNVEAGRARLRKYVVTEQAHQTVPVTHEEVRVQREPISEENRQAALSGPDLSESEHEVVLTAERPVVEKETVPVERVRLDTEPVTEHAEISEEIRKEQIDTEGIEGPRARR